MQRTPSTDVVDRIVRAALARLEAGGVRSVTLRAVCSAAGVSRQTVVNRFDSMDGLLDYLACRGFHALHQAVRGADTMDGIVERYRRWVAANPGWYRLMMQGPSVGLTPSEATLRAAGLAIGGLAGDEAFVRMLGGLQLELSGLSVGPAPDDAPSPDDFFGNTRPEPDMDLLGTVSQQPGSLQS